MSAESLLSQDHLWHLERVIILIILVLDDDIALPVNFDVVPDDLAVQAAFWWESCDADIRARGEDRACQARVSVAVQAQQAFILDRHIEQQSL